MGGEQHMNGSIIDTPGSFGVVGDNSMGCGILCRDKQDMLVLFHPLDKSCIQPGSRMLVVFDLLIH